MKPLASLFGPAFAALLGLAPQSALALNARSWVSHAGSDTNPCSTAFPCATFAGALLKTSAGGAINCLDSGEFASSEVDIYKSITISCVGVKATVDVSSGTGFNISAGPADKVVLEGLEINGGGPGYDGVAANSGSATYIINCTIRQFSLAGVMVASNTPNARVFIRDSNILLNGYGVVVQNGGVTNVASILNSLIDNNLSAAVQSYGAGSIVGLANSILDGSPTAISLINGGQAYSFGPSNVVSGAGSFTGGAAIPFQ